MIDRIFDFQNRSQYHNLVILFPNIKYIILAKAINFQIVTSVFLK